MLFFPHHPAALGYGRDRVWEEALALAAGFPSHFTGVCASVLVTQALPTWDEQCSSFLILVFCQPSSLKSLLVIALFPRRMLKRSLNLKQLPHLLLHRSPFPCLGWVV